jgi:hypothetical protein
LDRKPWGEPLKAGTVFLDRAEPQGPEFDGEPGQTYEPGERGPITLPNDGANNDDWTERRPHIADALGAADPFAARPVWWG